MRSRSSIATSIIVLLLAAFSIGGATMAWFTTEVDLGTSAFTAGTVNISNPEIISGSQDWQRGQWNSITWSFTNTGSKTAFLRVRPDIVMSFYAGTTEYSAWIEGIRIDPDRWYGQYIIYEKGEASLANPRRADLLEGSNANYVGYVEFWDDGTHLYIGYYMTEDYLLDEIQIYAGLTPPTHTRMGQYPFKFTFDTGLREFFWFETDHVYDQLETPRQQILVSSLADGTEIYFGAHCRLFQVSRYLQYRPGELCGPYWHEGADGWWYYGTEAGPSSVAPGETVNVCFEFFVAEDFDGEITVSLEAEAVQTTHDAIHYVWPANPWNTAPNPSLSITKQADRATAPVGETINYNIVVSNNGNVSLTGITVTDAMLGLNQTIDLLVPGSSYTATGTYTVGVGDSGTLVNTATAETTYGGQTLSASASASVTVAAANPSLSINKQSDHDTAVVGETINYDITVTNTGNVTLADIAVTDDKMPELDTTIASLAPGAFTTITGTYTVGTGDSGTLVNTATATVTYNGQTFIAEATATVTLTEAELTLFNSLPDGAYVRIDGVLFQKIGENWALRRTVLETEVNQATAVTQGENYFTNYLTVASSSHLLDRTEAEGLVPSIRINNKNWWTSTTAGPNGRYIDTEGNSHNVSSESPFGVRPSLLLRSDLDLYVTGGPGTEPENAYILVIPD